MKEETKKITHKKISVLAKVLLTVVIGGVIVALVYVCYTQFSQLQQFRGQDAAAEQAQAAAAALKDKISKYMLLPEEDAAVATIQDISKVADQEFFKNAQTGDKVLIFATAKKALIYRESENKIINFGPVVINSLQGTATPTSNAIPETGNVSIGSGSSQVAQ